LSVGGSVVRLLFFLCASRDLRDLHSFPTRRSSDLSATCSGRRDPSSTSSATGSSACGRSATKWRRRRRRWTRRSPLSTAPSRQRSEEHTSELQSRENLVCRLLLEKKKTV